MVKGLGERAAAVPTFLNYLIRNLTNEAGDVTSHISGFLARVVKLLENGIKPVREVYMEDAGDSLSTCRQYSKRSSKCFAHFGDVI